MEVQVRRAGLVPRRRVRRQRGALLPAAALGIAVLLPLAVLLGTVQVLGWQLHVFQTGSMAPGIPAGSLAVVEPLDPSGVRPGMTIVFDDPSGRERLVAHRAAKRLSGDPPKWRTKGDANAATDPYPVRASAIHGRVRWSVPHLGTIVAALHRPATAILLVGVPLALLAAAEAAALRRRRRSQAAAESVRVFAVREVSSTGDEPRTPYLDVFLRSEDAVRFVEEVRHERPDLADALGIVEHELDICGAA